MLVFTAFVVGAIVLFYYATSRSGEKMWPYILKAAQDTQAKAQLKQLPRYADRLSDSSYTDVEDAYYNRIKKIHVKCVPMPHIGHAGDGGWETCMTPSFKPKKPCLIYSFGVANMWKFDETLARDHGCTVRAFDPSMKDNDHVHLPGPVHFYKLGLAGSNRTLPSNGWKLFTFQSLLKRFGETDRTIDIVKMDIESSEWESLESMLETGVLERVKQLMFEVHTQDCYGPIGTKKDFLRYHKIFDGIEALGFRRFYQHVNKVGIGALRNIKKKSNDPVYKKSVLLGRSCLHELYYINVRFLTVKTGLEFL